MRSLVTPVLHIAAAVECTLPPSVAPVANTYSASRNWIQAFCDATRCRRAISRAYRCSMMRCRRYSTAGPTLGNRRRRNHSSSSADWRSSRRARTRTNRPASAPRRPPRMLVRFDWPQRPICHTSGRCDGQTPTDEKSSLLGQEDAPRRERNPPTALTRHRDHIIVK
jgi:hypothetical protein